MFLRWLHLCLSISFERVVPGAQCACVRSTEEHEDEEAAVSAVGATDPMQSFAALTQDNRALSRPCVRSPRAAPKTRTTPSCCFDTS